MHYRQRQVEKNAEGQLHVDTVLCLFCDIICRDIDAAMPIIFQHIEPAIPDEGWNIEQNDCELKDATEDLPSDTDAVDSPVVQPSLYQLSHRYQLTDILRQLLVLFLQLGIRQVEQPILVHEPDQFVDQLEDNKDQKDELPGLFISVLHGVEQISIDTGLGTKYDRCQFIVQNAHSSSVLDAFTHLFKFLSLFYF